MSVWCYLFGHADAIRDRANNGGPQVLRCSECWKIIPYPETNVSALRAEQQRQREQIARKAKWLELVP